MAKPQIVTGNLVSTIHECMEEHEVQVNGRPFYLIEVTSDSGLFEDFRDTYGYENMTHFQREIAERLMGKGTESSQIYGVLVSQDLTYSFAFNREFADLNWENRTIEFKTVEDVLLGLAEKASGTKKGGEEKRDGMDDFPVRPSDEKASPFDEWEYTRIKYALTGKKEGERQIKDSDTNKDVDFPQASLIDRIREAYKDSEVELDTGDTQPEIMFMIDIKYQTDTLQDLYKTYGEDAFDDFKKRVAEKAFGKKQKEENSYTVFLDSNLKICYTFNKRFAYFDHEKNQVIFVPLEDALLEKSKFDLSGIKRIKIDIPSPRRGGLLPRRPGGRDTKIKYALTGKKEECEDYAVEM